MKDCPFCRQPWAIGDHSPMPQLFAGPVPRRDEPNYNVRDAIEFTTRNAGTLTVLWQFITGLIAAWRKP